MTLSETIAEGRRLIAANKGKHGYCTMDPGPHAALRMLPALLDVAEAGAAYQEARRYANDLNAVHDGPEADAAFAAVGTTLAALDAALAALGLGPDDEGKEKRQ